MPGMSLTAPAIVLVALTALGLLAAGLGYLAWVVAALGGLLGWWFAGPTSLPLF